jgi:hypothetical protein
VFVTEIDVEADDPTKVGLKLNELGLTVNVCAVLKPVPLNR